MTSKRGKKIATAVRRKINKVEYARLLAETLPVAIQTEAEYERVLEAVDNLMSISEEKLRPEQNALLELLSTLIEHYEDEHYPIEDAPGHEVLRMLMEDRGIKQSDLLSLFGSRGIVSEIVSGKRPIGVAVAKKLGSFFNVSPEVFVNWQ